MKRHHLFSPSLLEDDDQGIEGKLKLPRKRKAHVFLPTVLALSSLLAAPVVSVAQDRGADPKGVSAGVADAATVALMKTQGELDRLADRVEAAKPESADSGVSGFSVDARRNTLQVHWKGAVSEPAAKEIDRARARGITVILQAAPYTQAQLRAEVTRLTELNMTSPAGSGTQLVSVGPKPDGSGIELGVSGLPAGADRARALKALPALASPIATDIVAMAAPEATGRFIDSTPFYGGGYIERRVNNVPQNACSSAFAAQNGGLSYMLTAAHCGLGDWFTGGSGSPRTGNYIGAAASRRDLSHDAMLIVTQSAPLMFDGGSIAGERPQFTKTVSGASTTRQGDIVCASGSFSGAVCDILATRTGLSINVRDFGTIIDVVHADRQSTPRQAAAGNGDSGGPMFSLDGSTRVVARGTISAMPSNPSLQDPCIGVPGVPADQEGRHCSHRIYYPDITAQMRTLGFSVKTG